MNSDDRSFLNWLAMALAVSALVLGFFALGRVGSTGEQAAGAGGGTGQASIIDVELGAMTFSPQHIMAPPGEVTLRITNVDSQVHNLSVLGSKSRDLQPGESQEMELGELGVGVYPMLCEIPGHNEAGMNGNLHIIMNAEPGAYTGSDTGAGGGERDHFHGFESWEAMQAAMDDRAWQYVEDEKSEFGGQLLEPTILADGTKEFQLYAEIVDWEVEPGKIVQAWTYNGMVPGPHIQLDVGDKARFVLENRLPVGTSIHWHGIDVVNSQDGVPPYTQPHIQPGETWVYEFTARTKGVGIYHSHSSAEQVLDGLFAAITIGQMEVPEVLLDKGFKAEPDQTINMVLNDAGVIGLTLNGKSFPATEIYQGKVGDTIMVHYYNEGLMPHPMHMHQPIGWVIARDGVELLSPWAGDTFNVAPGERWTVVYQLAEPGVWAWHCHILTHAERADGMFGMVTAFIVEE